MATVAELRKLVVDKNLVSDKTGVYRMPDGSLVSKAKKDELESLLNSVSTAAIPTESTLPIKRNGKVIQASALFDGNKAIQSCLARAERLEAEKGPRWRRRANYWRRTAKRIAGAA